MYSSFNCWVLKMVLVFALRGKVWDFVNACEEKKTKVRAEKQECELS